MKSKRFKLLEARLTWQEAKLVCEKHSSYFLPTIEEAREYWKQTKFKEYFWTDVEVSYREAVSFSKGVIYNDNKILKNRVVVVVKENFIKRLIRKLFKF